MHIINVADLKDPEDPQGRSYRQINHAKPHNIPLGTLVEYNCASGHGDMESGLRMFVVLQTRDCDGTPLYSLGPVPHEKQCHPHFGNDKWLNGYCEESLTPIRMAGPTLDQLRQHIQDFTELEGNICGGNLHIVIDDGNIDDVSIDFCIAQCKEKDDWKGLQLAEKLKYLTLEQRAELLNVKEDLA